ncbi:MAG TPA: group II truncated hemoglobin [Acidimicrobiia bacterium]|nr:group II truncated hemoglobin [Acidimicrobiia bacterium]
MQIQRSSPWGDAPNVYEAIGGDEMVRRIADTFYDIIEAESPTIQAMLPANTRVSRQKLYEFLSGWMGGPQLYWERRGHPALRMRHAPFPIDQKAAEEWAACMSKTLELCEVPEPARQWLDRELGRVAMMLRNRAEPAD